MKPKKILNHLAIGFSACLVLFTSSCVKENNPKMEAYADPMLRIKVTVPKAQTVSTRALYETLETVQDLNVIVYFDNAHPEVFYFDASDNRLPLESGSERMFEINGLNILQADQISVYLVANYGEPLLVSSIGTPDDLKSIKLLLPETWNKVPENCVMFAYAGTIDLAEETSEDFRMYLDAELERTLAKVTLGVEGCNTLKEGLTITPTSLHIMNIPANTWLGKENKPSGANIFQPGYQIPVNMGAITQGISRDDHNLQAFALYLFENKQGEKEMNDGEAGKEATGDFEYASYIEITANYSYSYFDDQGGLSQAVGDIIYRFCLGGDVDMDYNVMRNTHYQVTLVLDGWGGAKEGGMVDDDDNIIIGMSDPDVNWRVDLDLADWGFTGNSNIGGCAYYGSFGLSTNSSIKIYALYWGQNDWSEWMGVRKNQSNGTWKDIVAETSASTSKGYFQFYVKPWRTTDGGYPGRGLPQYKDVQIYLQPANGAGEADEFFIKQWTPVKIDDDIYMERFEDLELLLAPWLSSTGTVPMNMSANDQIGWENTLLSRRDSPAAQIALRKAGLYWGKIEGVADEIPTSGTPFYGTMKRPVNAAFYLPSKDELQIMLNFMGDMTDPYNTYLPLDRSADYWTSTVDESEPGAVCYWDGTAKIFKYTTDLTTLKRVRAIYRPSLDSEIDNNLSNLPWK